VSKDTETPSQESPDSEAPTVKPLEVKVTNPVTPKPSFYDAKDDIEYEEIILSDEDKDI